MNDWDPTTYARFADHRLRPALDLLDRTPLDDVRTAYDLGCGAGAAALEIKRRRPSAHVVGVDASPEMLGRARVHAGVTWVEADLATWRPESPPDLIFSNAALHWIGGHDVLFPRLVASLAPGGVLAVQMPRNFDASSHTAAAVVAREGPWSSRFAARPTQPPVDAPSRYYDRLASSASTIDIWETEYLHVLEGDDPVVTWTRSTALRPYLAALAADEVDAFLAEYRRRVASAYPSRKDGTTLFPFRRLFIVARA